ncbi:MAG: winged helix-turn-helix transcriptional regulator [Deltaproteobacteria bacterium]|nr:winged helix-turn-helix transcriptional regulator [Deltaproteobacteria bacterium]
MKNTAIFFKVLADEARLQILWLLNNYNELCVCDIMAVLKITQSKASRHLATLVHAKLIKCRKDGLWSYYTLLPADDELIGDQLKTLMTNLSNRSEATALLTKLLAQLQSKKQVGSCVKKRKCKSTKSSLKNMPVIKPIKLCTKSAATTKRKNKW